MNSICLLTILVLVSLAMVQCLPPAPELPVKELCDTFYKKCSEGRKNEKCKSRKEECVNYANQGIKTTWSFCMYSNNDDTTVCNERIKVDFKIIEDWVMKGEFHYDATLN